MCFQACKPIPLEPLTENQCLISKESYFEGEENLIGWIEYRYDKKWNLEEKNLYDEMGNLIYQELREFDMDGNLISLTIFDNGELTGRAEIERDSEGKIRLTRSFDSYGELTGREEYIYNEQDQLIKLSTLIPPDNFNTSIFEYTPEGKTASVILYEGDEISGSIQSRREYVYDMNCQILEEKNFSGNHEAPWRWIKWTYDDKGEVSSYTFIDVNGNIVEERYFQSIFDMNGNIIDMTTFDENNNFITRTLMEYDAEGNRIRKIIIDIENNTLESYNYEYVCYSSIIH